MFSNAGIDFIEDLSCVLHLYFSENANAIKKGKAQKLVFKYFKLIKHI